MNYLDASVEVSKDDPPVTFGDIPLAKGDKIEKPFYRRRYRLPPLTWHSQNQKGVVNMSDLT